MNLNRVTPNPITANSSSTQEEPTKFIALPYNMRDSGLITPVLVSHKERTYSHPITHMISIALCLYVNMLFYWQALFESQTFWVEISCDMKNLITMLLFCVCC